MSGPDSPPGDQSEQVLALQRQVQELRLTVQDRDAQIARLQADLEKQRKDEQNARAADLRAAREKLGTEVAGPVAQLLTQAHLLEQENKPVQARDVLAVARRLVGLLQE